jgi:signal peptidase I
MKVRMARRIVRRILDVALVAAVLLAVFVAYGVVGNRWYHIVSIVSGSMEPAIATGSLVVVTPAPAVLEPGMVISFIGDGRLVTHRVVAVRPDGLPVTRGDANNVDDHFAKVTVVGRVAFSIPLLGFVLPSAGGSAAQFAEDLASSQEIQVGPFQPTPTPTPVVPPTPPEAPRPAPTSTPGAPASADPTASPDPTPVLTPDPTTPTNSIATPDPTPQPTATPTDTILPTAVPAATPDTSTPPPAPTASASASASG